MKKSRFWAFLGRKQYVIAGAIVVAAAVATTVIYSDHQQQQREQLEEELAQENAPEEAGLVAATESTEQTAQASAVIPPEQTAEAEQLEQTAEAVTTESTEVAQVEKEAENETAETGAGVNALHFDPEDGMLWPMEGNVILNYSMDQTVYFATLDQYKYNDALMLGCESGETVQAAANGQVVSISEDVETGTTMVMDLGNGYQATYGQLKDITVEPGQTVESGTILGYVSDPTKYYVKEGANLYFAMTKDGNPIDPMIYIETVTE